MDVPVWVKWAETLTGQLHLLLGHAWERLGASNVGAEIKGKWEWRLGCASAQSFSHSDLSAHQNFAVDPRRFYPCAQGGRKSLPLVSVAPGRSFLFVPHFGCPWNGSPNAWFKAGKGGFFWHLTEMTPKSGEGLSRGGFGRVERGKKQVEKSICGGG